MKYYQIMRVMKITMLLTLCCLLHVSATTLGQTLSIKKANATIQEILEDIRQQASYDFFYDADLFTDADAISLDIKNATINQVLDRCFAESAYTYTIANKIVTIKKDSGKKVAKTHTMAVLPPRQTARITGRVVDENRAPLEGATITVKENGRSVQTDPNGKYEIVVAPGTYTIRVSYISYESVQLDAVTVSADQPKTLDITLKSTTDALEEVVVTSLGLTSAKRRIGTSIQEIKGDDINTAKSGNALTALQGKVAGMNMTMTSGGMASSSRIVLRGESSLNINKNAALVVVDGVPINNNNGTGSSSDLSVDYGSGGAEINPDDIESISVLKGANAAALYGSRAANGAVIITTKSASKSTTMGVSINSNTTFDQVLKLPDFQNEYGGGTGSGLTYYSYGDGPDGPNTSNSGHNWGAPFKGQRFIQFGSPLDADGNRVAIPWEARPNNVRDFYELGRTLINSVSVSKSGELGDFRASYNNYAQTGVMPNTELKRNQFNLNSTANISTKVSVRANMNYINSYSDNLPIVGYGGSSPTYNFIWFERNADINWFKRYWVPGQEDVKQDYYFTWGDNPYLTMYEQLNGMKRNRVFGNAAVDFQILPQLKAMVRTGIDYSGEMRSSQRPYSSVVNTKGLYRRQDLTYLERNSDFLVTYQGEETGSVHWSANIGGNNLQINTAQNTATANGLTIPGVYNLGNAGTRPAISEVNTVKRVNSLYAFADLGYKNQLFVQLTGRNDWSSTLPEGNNSYFYPSISTSAILSDLLGIRSTWMNFWKLRSSFAQVGNDTDPYQTAAYYEYSTLPGTVGLPATMPNFNLKPEITSSFEVGTEFRLLANRLHVDFTWYTSQSKNQILRSPLSISTGYTDKIMNAGKINNRGWEALVTVTPIKNQLTWDITLTAAANRSRVVELADGVESYVMASAQGATVEARVGGRMGDIYGIGLQRNEAGQIIYRGGVPVFTNNTMKIGNYNPDLIAGIKNTLNYKTWSLGFLFDGRLGGTIYSFTHVTGTEAGSLSNTLPGREEGIVGDGVVLNDDGTYSPNTERVSAYAYYRGFYRRPNVESNSFDASFIKLRELTLGYRLPSKLIKKTPLKSVHVNLVGRNLLLFAKAPHIDPETSFVSGGTIVPGIENAQIPSTRSFGFDIKLSL
ncbi:SusC/RagA family TonB-linked outer membrane protein [Parapedobacter deserti]|uniref:SusC/RagA family TonB-linked outer membrane protein n=2 Tax=Parapedobacter deserti TaxID=1912957 RepID=A0ABV7JHI1_9SPHI